MTKSSLSSHFSLILEYEQLTRIHSYLLQWYAAEHRDLPWRSTHDPYAILVSEMMLQQTQVQRVLPKYEQSLPNFQQWLILPQAQPPMLILAGVPLAYICGVFVLH